MKAHRKYNSLSTNLKASNLQLLSKILNDQL